MKVFPKEGRDPGPALVFRGALDSTHLEVIALARRAGLTVLISPELALGAGDEDLRTMAEAMDDEIHSRRPRVAVSQRAHVGALLIDRAAHRVAFENQDLNLSEQEFQILASLGESPGTALSFEDLFVGAWRAPYFGNRDVIAAAIKRLRKKLAKAGCRDHLIVAVPGFGYRLSPDNA